MIPQAKPYRHIIWDWNGTLLDDAPICVQVLNQVLARHGKLPTTLALYRAQFGFPVEDYYQQLGFNFSVESYDVVADDYIEIYRQRQVDCSLHDGVPEVLDLCLRAGLTQSILSAYQQDLLTEVVRHFGLSSFFVQLAGRKDYFAASKVAEGQRLIRDLGLEPSQILLVGDTLHDHQVAQTLGIDCLLIGRGHQNPDRLRLCGTPILNSIRQVPTFLAGRSPESVLHLTMPPTGSS
jgi:phosphoglycolate phosphatase